MQGTAAKAEMEQKQSHSLTVLGENKQNTPKHCDQ